MTKPLFIDSLEAAVDHVLDTIPGDIVLGIPLAVGKPNPFVNALYRRIKANPARKLRIITALSLIKPVGKSELEQHFLEPLVERVFADYPDLEYAVDLRAHALPPNIEVREFFMKTGDYIGNEAAQQNYISTNYTFVARDMAVQGMNVIAQAVGAQGEGDDLRLSMSSNPDIVCEVVENMRAAGQPLLKVAVINRKMPFMPNGAELSPDFYDVVVTDPAATHVVFGPPNNKVSAADYAIGLHASSLVTDGGTLQIGIGSLGDAIAQALIVRDRHGEDYRSILETLTPDGLAGRELGRFDQGLYGCSEMFVNGFLKLIEAGIIRREVYGDTVLQQMLNDGRLPSEVVTPETVRALLAAGRIGTPLSEADVAFLKKFGILRAGVTLDGRELVLDGERCSSDLADKEAFDKLCATMLGARLIGGIYMTGGFFLGPNDFYERLRTMPPQELAKIDMTRIDFINQLYGQGDLKRAQRRKARFMNTTMIATLLGAVASDALESGQVVSGVGGQYNFVAMAHALPDARLLMMLRATHDNKDGLKSSIVWNYGHVWPCAAALSWRCSAWRWRWACFRPRASTWSAGWASASRPTCATPSTPMCCAKPRVLRDHADRRGAVAPDHRHHAGADRGGLVAEHGPAQHRDGHRRAGHAGLWTNPYVMLRRCWACWCWWCCPACGSAGACASSRAPARTAWPTPAPSPPRC
jgi:acyl-CoA hydrolase